jgi:Ni2+-binding GTPase involved in maturation of urease and hydrogenase
MDFHIVSGFLGSGKTTAIIAASKILMSQGKRVGVVTNDQGKFLVDTAFFELSSVPAVEVTGGCFCCNYDDLDARLDELKATAQPDVIFAESVGSCADIVATVVKPLLQLRSDTYTPSSFSVFTDARMLNRRLQDLPMPFSDDVVYIYDKQIEEAGMLIINKKDLLSDKQSLNLMALARNKYPGKHVILQNSLNIEDIKNWLKNIDEVGPIQSLSALDIDYQRYGAGEQQLAWLDEKVTLKTTNGKGKVAALTFLNSLMNEIEIHNISVGHIKVILKSENTDLKLSFVAMRSPGWQDEVPELTGTHINILLNARVEGEPDALREMVRNAIIATHKLEFVQVEESSLSSFKPVFPVPVHRITN